MMTLTLTTPLHGFTTTEPVTVLNQDGYFVLLQDSTHKNPRTVPIEFINKIILTPNHN